MRVLGYTLTPEPRNEREVIQDGPASWKPVGVAQKVANAKLDRWIRTG